MIVDDGSTDGLDFIINQYAESVPYPILYIKKENGGKHTAENIAFRNSTGEYLVQLDSDDELLPDALNVFMHYWEIVNQRPDADLFWCVSCGLRYQLKEGLRGDAFPSNINDIDDKTRRKILRNIHGDKSGCMRRDVVSKFQFPETKGVKFVTESIVWNAIEKNWKSYYTNDIVGVYYINEGNSLSNPVKSKQHFANTNWNYRYDKINSRDVWSLIDLLKYLVSYYLATDGYRRTYHVFDLPLDKREKILAMIFWVPSRCFALFKSITNSL